MIVFMTQYYRGLGHSMRIKHIAEEVAKTHETMVVHHLLKPPLEYNVQHEVALMTRDMIDTSQRNLYEGIMTESNVNARLHKYYKAVLPHIKRGVVFISEGWPLCRHQFAYELFQITDWNKTAGATQMVSIRDFPWDEPHSLSLQDWVAITQNKVINEYYDTVLVHGDESALSMYADTVSHANPTTIVKELSRKLLYTGYVVNHNQQNWRGSNSSNKIYVSCGLNKEESLYILKEFLVIAKQMPEYNFIFPIANEHLTKQLGLRSKNNVTIVDYIPNLQEKLTDCALFITYGGYNSTMEVINGHIPAIIIPRSDGRKLEQFVRCYTFEKYDMFKVCSPDRLRDIPKIIKQIEKQADFPKKCPFDLNGVQKSAEYIIRKAEMAAKS